MRSGATGRRGALVASAVGNPLVSRSVMIDVTELVGTVFSGLSALVIEDVADGSDVIVVRAGTRDVAVACPGCGTGTARVHGYRDRTAADVPVDGRRVQVRVRARRLRCAAPGCPRQTFREQVPGVLERCQRRTARLTGQVSAIARELAGRASARLLPALGIPVSSELAACRLAGVSNRLRSVCMPHYCLRCSNLSAWTASVVGGRFTRAVNVEG
jgi:hypothetical protein